MGNVQARLATQGSEKAVEIEVELLRCMEAAVTALIRDQMIPPEQMAEWVEAVWEKRIDAREAARQVVNDWMQRIREKE